MTVIFLHQKKKKIMAKVSFDQHHNSDVCLWERERESFPKLRWYTSPIIIYQTKLAVFWKGKIWCVLLITI